MEITKVVKPFIRRGANTFGNIVYDIILSIFIYSLLCSDVCDDRKCFISAECVVEDLAASALYLNRFPARSECWSFSQRTGSLCTLTSCCGVIPLL